MEWRLRAIFSLLSGNSNNKYLIALLPVFAAILLEGHTRYLSLRLDSPALYLKINLQLLLECLPFLIAHLLTFKGTYKSPTLVWLTGFTLYPLSIYTLALVSSTYAQWQYLSVQCWILCSLASLLWLVSQRNKTNKNSLIARWFISFISLDNVVLMILICWAFLFAGILNSHQDPLLNQPFELIFDVGKFFSELNQFLFYFLQLGVYAVIIYSLYLINRYVLIRHLLANYGVFTFVASCLIFMATLTPLLIALVLTLPINDLPQDIANLTPSGNQNIFAKYNYQFMFFFLIITTPIILAFERQQQQSKLNEIAKQQTKTELKLLQQQVNPHFLFNTLNNLYALTLTKSEHAPQLVMHLADLLRYTVYEGQKPVVLLEKELAYLKSFIELQKIRSANKYLFNLTWPDRVDDLHIAPLLLIIIVENAIKHGVEPASDSTKVTLAITINDTVLTLFCENSISTQTEKSHPGMGLCNLQKRLELLYPNKHTLTAKKHATHWQTTLTLELSK